MKYTILSKEPLYCKTKYTIDLELDEGEVLDKDVLIEKIGGHVWGGTVKQNTDGTVDVICYTD